MWPKTVFCSTGSASPHKKFGTTYRILNTMAILQILTILASRGDVFLLGEAYAFGVVWSFALKALGVLVLRYQRHDQEYKMPVEHHIAGKEIPIGLGLTTSMLFLVAIANLFSKKIATIYGVSFTIVLYTLFMISERINARKKLEHRSDLEKFNLDHQAEVRRRRCTRGPAACWWRFAITTGMHHLQKTLEKTNLRRHDIVVMTVRQLSTGAGEYELRDDQLFAGMNRNCSLTLSRSRKSKARAWNSWSCRLSIPSMPWCRRQQSACLETGGGRFCAHGVRRARAVASGSPGSGSPRRGIRFRSKSPIPTAPRRM